VSYFLRDQEGGNPTGNFIITGKLQFRAYSEPNYTREGLIRTAIVGAG
jgi:hypothetical protein